MTDTLRLSLSLAAVAVIGCGQPLDEPAPCPADAVALQVADEAWCAHHDVRRFTCPVDLPERQSHLGVAFCGTRIVDEATADVIARTALRTGEILEQRSVRGFDLPADWRLSPGAPAATPLDITARTWTASNLSWTSNDGDAALCERRFDRFEIEPDGAGRLRISAWDRLTCGPEVVGVGAESSETLPLTLPALDPGRYLLAGDGAGQGSTPSPLVVGLDAICPAPRPIEACFRGHFFADCGAADGLEAGLWCAPAPHQHQCVWSVCPPAGYSPLDCGGDPYCPTPHEGWDETPWDRTRSMDLAVNVDPGLDAAPVEVVCMGDADERPAQICRTPPDGWAVQRSPAGDDGWGWPSLIRLHAVRAEPDLGDGWTLLVEIDVFAADGPGARACLVSYSDGGTSGEPACAEAGAVTLDRLPESADDVATLRATIHAEFPAFARDALCDAPCLTEGLVIDARL